jgi:arylsulfatase A-like enzyme
MKRTHLLPTIVIFALGSLAATADDAAAAERPNVLLITADNLGYGDLPCFNPHSAVRAPHLDRLASEGARLTGFYTASPTCTVSRACLLTGRIAQRHGLDYQLPGIEGNYGRGLNPSETLIPQLLKKAGYATGCFGKWNIGFKPGSRPTERGFDEFFGHASGNIDYYTHNYNRKHDLYRGIAEARVEGYSTDLFADAAIDFIRRGAKQKKPWFVYLPFNAPHYPNPRNKAPDEPCIWQAPDSAFEVYGYDPATKDEQERYRAVLTALDAAIGRVLATLDELSLAEKTFVFFYSDNGAFMLKQRGLEVASNAPLRDGGVTCWEGGIRVAAMARWPGHIPAGQTIDEPLWSPDLFVACARLAGAELPRERKLDGRDPLPVLTAGKASPHRSLYFRYGRHTALRMGDWKIVRTRPTEPWQLFDLSNDVGERNDLAAREAERLGRLTAELKRWEQDLAATKKGPG